MANVLAAYNTWHDSLYGEYYKYFLNLWVSGMSAKAAALAYFLRMREERPERRHDNDCLSTYIRWAEEKEKPTESLRYWFKHRKLISEQP